MNEPLWEEISRLLANTQKLAEEATRVSVASQLRIAFLEKQLAKAEEELARERASRGWLSAFGRAGGCMTIPAWKFIGADHKLRYADKRELRAGETLTGPLGVGGGAATLPILCSQGFHASIRARDALRYAGYGMNHIARVEIGGATATGSDKVCGMEIKCLWVADATHALRVFAVQRRKAQMISRLAGREPSLAALWAIDCAERFLDGEAEADELEAAKAAAYAAAADYDAYDAYADAAAAYDDMEAAMLALEPK